MARRPIGRNERREAVAAEKALVVMTAVIALAGWIDLERTGEVGRGIAAFGGAFLGLGLLGGAVHCARERDGITATLDRMLAVRRSDPWAVQFGALGGPGRAAWLLPFALVPLMALTLPIAFHTSPGDWSILGVLAFFVVLLGYGGLLLGVLVWVMVLFPLMLLARALARLTTRRRDDDPDERVAVGLALLLLSIIAFAVTIVLAAPHSEASSTRAAQRSQFAALIGLGHGHVDHPMLLWVARASVLAIAGAVLMLVAARGRRDTQ